MTKEKSAKKKTLKLPETADISAIDGLHLQMKEAIASAKEIQLEGKDVDRITTPCIQILLSAYNSLKDSDKGFSLKEPSEECVAAFEDMGLDEYIKRWKRS